MNGATLLKMAVAAAMVAAVLAKGGTKQDEGDDYDDLLGGQDDDDDDDDYGFTSLMKKVSGHKNHHVGHHDPFWQYLALLTIKAKVVLVAVLIALGTGVFFYYGHHKCACPGPPLHHYSHDFPDRKGRSVDVDLVARVVESIGTNYLEFNTTDAKMDACKKRLLCELGQLARSQPVIANTIKIVRLGKWTSEDYNFTRDGMKRCSLLHPDCVF